MSGIRSYAKLEDFARIRLSKNFFVRDFLHSEIAAWNGMQNLPDNPDMMVEVGRRICVELLEPLQATFGRIHIRSAYRSPTVNEFGNRNGMNCASNEANYAGHIWDYPDKNGKHGGTACIVIPWLVDRIDKGGHWTQMAWWIHDYLPYNSLYFFPRLAAFNISWHEQPQRRIDSYAPPKGCLTRAGMPNHAGSHEQEYVGYPELMATMARAIAPQVRPSHGLPPPISGAAKAELPVPTQAGKSSRGGSVAAAPVISPVRGPGQISQIRYRAVHTKTAWRKVNTHRSLEAAINGKDGAVALFAGKARISYETHGTPLYVAVWEEGATNGFVLAPNTKGGVRKVIVPIDVLAAVEKSGKASAEVLGALLV